MTTLLKPKRENQLIVATILLVLSLAINIATAVWVVNRPIEMVLIHKADNAVKLHGKVTGKSKIKNL